MYVFIQSWQQPTEACPILVYGKKTSRVHTTFVFKVQACHSHFKKMMIELAQSLTKSAGYTEKKNVDSCIHIPRYYRELSTFST